MNRLLTSTAALVLATAACSTASPHPPTAGSAVPPATTAGTPPTAATSTTIPALPSPPDGAPVLLLAGTSGIALVDGRGLLPPAEPADTSLHIAAYSDGAGGLVWATLNGDVQDINWWPRGGEPRVVTSGRGEALLDVASVAGRPAMLISRFNPGFFTGDEPPADTLAAIDLRSGDEVILADPVDGELAWAALGDGIVAVVTGDRTCGTLRLIDFDGEAVAAPGVPTPDCSVLFTLPFGPVAFGLGTSFAYIDFSWVDGDTGPSLTGVALVVADYAAAGRSNRIDLTEVAPANPAAVDFDGRWAVVSGWGPDGPARPLLVDTTTGSVYTVAAYPEEAHIVTGDPVAVGGG